MERNKWGSCSQFQDDVQKHMKNGAHMEIKFNAQLLAKLVLDFTKKNVEPLDEPYTTGVYFEPGDQGRGVIGVASTGSRMLVVHDEFGKIDGDSFLFYFTPEFAKAAKTKRATWVRVFDDYVYVANDSFDEIYVDPGRCKLLNTRYPDFRYVLKKIRDYSSLCPVESMTFPVAQMSTFAFGKEDVLRIVSHGADDPIIVRNIHHPEIFGLIMPPHLVGDQEEYFDPIEFPAIDLRA